MSPMRKHCNKCGTRLLGDDSRLGRCRECRHFSGIEGSLAVADVAATTPHRPGSPHKMVVMALRLRAGLSLHSPGESVSDIPD